jgi:hypothetical protein
MNFWEFLDKNIFTEGFAIFTIVLVIIVWL